MEILNVTCPLYLMFSKYYGGLSCYNDHSNDGNNDHDDDECIMENRDKEENFSYL